MEESMKIQKLLKDNKIKTELTGIRLELNKTVNLTKLRNVVKLSKIKFKHIEYLDTRVHIYGNPKDLLKLKPFLVKHGRELGIDELIREYRIKNERKNRNTGIGSGFHTESVRPAVRELASRTRNNP